MQDGLLGEIIAGVGGVFSCALKVGGVGWPLSCIQIDDMSNHTYFFDSFSIFLD